MQGENWPYLGRHLRKRVSRIVEIKIKGS